MSYLYPYLQGKNLKKIVQDSIDLLDHRKVRFDTVAVRGASGLLVGAPLAAATQSNVIIVRKDEERTHSDTKIENWGRNQQILLVDDFIESGNTIDQMYETIIEKCDSPKIVGILLYAGTEPASDRRTYTHPDGTVFPVHSFYRYNYFGRGERVF